MTYACILEIQRDQRTVNYTKIYYTDYAVGTIKFLIPGFRYSNCRYEGGSVQIVKTTLTNQNYI